MLMTHQVLSLAQSSHVSCTAICFLTEISILIPRCNSNSKCLKLITSSSLLRAASLPRTCHKWHIFSIYIAEARNLRFFTWSLLHFHAPNPKKSYSAINIMSNILSSEWPCYSPTQNSSIQISSLTFLSENLASL